MIQEQIHTNQAKAKQIREVDSIVKYYENDFPKQGELVMVECISCEENGCYVEILEYQRKKGMVPLAEYTTSMKKNIHRAMKVGRVEVARVTKVDVNKGYIDMSKSKVNPTDQSTGQQKFAAAKALHSIIINIAKDTKQVPQIYTSIVWPLYKKHPNSYPRDLLKKILEKEERADELGFTDPRLKADLVAELKRRFKKSIVKCIAIFRVSVVKLFDGIIKIKEILTAGAQASKAKDYDVKITILGAPDYLCEISTATKEEGEQALMLTLNTIKVKAEEAGGQFIIQMKPKVVGDSSHAIHQIYAQQMDTQDQGVDEEQMGDEQANS